MILNADDHGCTPNGRLLERATIAADSAILTDVDRKLRATDVGKSIAIPGAADLVALIVELEGRRNVANVSMTAGSKLLTAPSPPLPGQAFRADLDLGQRITVAGAGPGGAALVSDVVEVVSTTELRLADAAALTVNQAAAILNRPDLVGLSNHARASADNVTVNLGDRIVTDAQMTIGSRGLQSVTAKFSSVDLGKMVTITNAGFLLTTIQSFQSPTQVSLASTAQRGVTDGTADIWKAETDSRPGFEQLLASLDSLDVEGAEIHFGPGVYDFSRSPQSGLVAAITLRSLRNVAIRGAGPGATILRLMPNQNLPNADTHVIHVFDCRNLTIGDLSVHGAYLTLAQVNEQMHGIQVSQGSEEILVERVRVFQSAGDGIRMVGAENNKVRKIWIEGCRLIQNKRAGVGFQRAVEFAWIRDCYIEATHPSTDACIHSEPTGSVASTDIIIDGNVLVHGTAATAATFSGISGTDPTLRVRFINNTLQGGGIQAVNAQDVVVANNMILAGADGPVVTFRGACSGLRISNNKIVAPAGVRTAIVVANLGAFTSSGVWIESNHIEAAAGAGIAITDPGSHFEIRGNRLFGGGLDAIGISVHLEPPAGSHFDFKLTDNTIANFRGGGIQLSTTNSATRFEGVAIRGNNIFVDVPGTSGGSFGISFPKPGAGIDRWLVDAIVSENLLATVSTKIQRDPVTVPFIATAGNPGDCTIFEGAGSPDGIVTASVGSLFLRQDAVVNTALYVKQSGASEVGWIEVERSGQ